MRKIILNLSFLLLFLLIPSWYLSAQYIPQDESSLTYLPAPLNTEFIEKEIDDSFEFETTTTYKYRTWLSFEEIVSFYRDLFLQEGYKESKYVPPYDDGREYHFKQGFNRDALLVIYDPHYGEEGYDEGITYTYYVMLSETRDLLALSMYNFSEPKRDGSFPIPPPPRATEAKSKYPKAAKAASSFYRTYLSPGNIDIIVEFYLDKMEIRKWELKGRDSHEGRYGFFEAIGGKTPQTDATFSELGISPEEFYPGINLNVKGERLRFEKGNEVCDISMVQFKDPPEVLEQMRLKPEYFKKYGNIYIMVQKFDKNTLKKHEKEAQKTRKEGGKLLRDYFGLD